MLYLIFDRLPKDKIIRRMRWYGREHLDAGFARGKGVYVAMAPVGSHHVAALLMSLVGYKTAVVRDRKEGASRRYIQQLYEQSFPEVRDMKVFYSDSFPRDIYRCFANNYLLGSALDVERVRGLNLKTQAVTLFGEPRDFLTGTMQIALRCGATILQGFIVSGKNYYFHLHVSPPLVDPATQADDPDNLAAAMQAYADGIADHVRQHPDHLSKLF